MRHKSIFLIGFSGSGKTATGPRLARRLKLPFYDADTFIEREDGRIIADIFEQSGENRFRELESKIIARFCRKAASPAIVALGGGAFQNRANRQLLLKCGLTIYLSCSAREIYRRLRGKEDRPLMNVPLGRGESLRQARLRRIRTLLDSRTPNYTRAHIRVSTSRKSHAAVVNELLGKIRRWHDKSDR